MKFGLKLNFNLKILFLLTYSRKYLKVINMKIKRIRDARIKSYSTSFSFSSDRYKIKTFTYNLCNIWISFSYDFILLHFFHCTIQINFLLSWKIFKIKVRLNKKYFIWDQLLKIYFLQRKMFYFFTFYVVLKPMNSLLRESHAKVGFSICWCLENLILIGKFLCDVLE